MNALPAAPRADPFAGPPARGPFIGPGEKLYEGMVIGENAKPQDFVVSPQSIRLHHR